MNQKKWAIKGHNSYPHYLDKPEIQKWTWLLMWVIVTIILGAFVIIPLSSLAIVIYPRFSALWFYPFVLKTKFCHTPAPLRAVNDVKSNAKMQKMSCNLLWFYSSLYYVIVVVPLLGLRLYRGSLDLLSIYFHIIYFLLINYDFY